MQKDTSQLDIIFENEDFAILNKKRGLPTAPLKAGDTSLLTQFLNEKKLEEKVIGKKAIEAGLLHRLDTATSGLVLIAKKQKMYNLLQNMQAMHLIRKEYLAFCDYVPASRTNLIIQIEQNTSHSFSFNIESNFVPFGKKGQKVKACLNANNYAHHKKITEKRYITNVLIEKSDCLNEIKNILLQNTEFEKKERLKGGAVCRCSLTQGYRHQVRCHLASIGLPIEKDALYNIKYIEEHTKEQIESEKINSSYQLQLYAIKLTFPSPYSKDKTLSFSLPQLDKKNP